MDGAIYRDYNQESLDVEYNNRGRFPDTADCKAAQIVGSDQAKAEFECRLDVKFGDGETDARCGAGDDDVASREVHAAASRCPCRIGRTASAT